MEQRDFRRIAINLAAEIVSGDGTVYEGEIENISASGVGCIINTVIKNPEGFVPTLKTFSINFQTATDGTLYLDCELKRLTRALGSKDLVLGLRVIGSPAGYLEFIRKAESGPEA